MTADLSRLSDGERRVLALLADGHTAKSAAAATGLSVNAVNERLREARRKAGIGSSRELARLDEKIGVADVMPPTDPPLDAAPTNARGGHRRRLTMLTVVAAGIAAAALFSFRRESPAATAVRVEAVLGDEAGEPRDFRRRLVKEDRDPSWATPAEAKLRPLYTAIPAMRALTVKCRKTLCEVVGELPSSEAMSIGLVQVIPSKAPLDLDLLNLTFSIAEREPGTVTFVTYWLRHPA